jgi:hypothetical protein
MARLIESRPSVARCTALAPALLVATLTLACGGKIDPNSQEMPDPYKAECAGSATPPDDLQCTGLYTNLAKKVLAKGVREYAPAISLWADTAEKGRWIMLPKGKVIDATDPNEWVFPVGTKVWKEFRRDGRRFETRLWQKAQSNYWVRTTYRWSADESAAITSKSVDIALEDGGTYHIPSGDECDQCHRGRTEKILGFEQSLLGLSGSTGLTLKQLVAEKLISPAPTLTDLRIGDDGTGAAVAPLGWLHANCGVSCHNGNSNSTGYGASQRLRLDPTLLDGRPSNDFESLTSTVNVMSDTPAWAGQTRIVPGQPDQSLMVQLISHRGTDNPEHNQMPPIATLMVDQADTQSVVDWIAKMPGR